MLLSSRWVTDAKIRRLSTIRTNRPDCSQSQNVTRFVTYETNESNQIVVFTNKTPIVCKTKVSHFSSPTGGRLPSIYPDCSQSVNVTSFVTYENNDLKHEKSRLNTVFVPSFLAYTKQMSADSPDCSQSKNATHFVTYETNETNQIVVFYKQNTDCL